MAAPVQVPAAGPVSRLRRAPSLVLRVEDAAALARLSVDEVRARTSPSWRGPGHRLHGHRGPGHEWLFTPAVIAAYLDGADHSSQIDICGPGCPEADERAYDVNR